MTLVTAPLASCQTLRGEEEDDLLYVQWFEDAASARGGTDRQRRQDTLDMILRVLGEVSVTRRMHRLIVDASSMPVWFAVGHLSSWLRAVAESPGWSLIRQDSLVVTGSGVASWALSNAPGARPSMFVDTVEEACRRAGVDAGLLL